MISNQKQWKTMFSFLYLKVLMYNLAFCMSSRNERLHKLSAFFVPDLLYESSFFFYLGTNIFFLESTVMISQVCDCIYQLIFLKRTLSQTLV